MNSFLIRFRSKWPSFYFLPSISQERLEEDNAFCSCCSKSLTCSAWGMWAQFEWALKRFCTICQCRTPLALREFSSVWSCSGAFWQPDNWPCSQVANARMAGLGHLQIKYSVEEKENWKEFLVEYSWLPIFYLNFLVKIYILKKNTSEVLEGKEPTEVLTGILTHRVKT